jgi:RNA polymerase sigma-70 factor, ECF subfamily
MSPASLPPATPAPQCVEPAGKAEDLFPSILAAHLQPLRSYLALLAPIPSLVDAVTHQAFITAHAQLDQRKGELGPWLRSIALAELHQQLQHQPTAEVTTTEQLLRIELAREGLQAAHDTHTSANCLATCLERLPQPLRLILEQSYSLQRSAEQIAADTGRTSTAVRSLLVRIRHQLKHCLETQVNSPIH